MKTGKTRKVQTNKTNYMSEEAFADLKGAMEDALAFERGKAPRFKGHADSGSAPAKGNVATRHCSNTRTIELLSGSVRNPTEHQPENGPGLGTRFKKAG